MYSGPCTECGKREAVARQRVCRPCLRLRSWRLTREETAFVRSLLEALSANAFELMGPYSLDVVSHAQAGLEAIRLGKRIPRGSANLAAAALGACAWQFEEDTGLRHLVCEHVFRRLTHEDRVTGTGPPWSDIAADNRARLDAR